MIAPPPPRPETPVSCLRPNCGWHGKFADAVNETEDASRCPRCSALVTTLTEAEMDGLLSGGRRHGHDLVTRLLSEG